MYYAGIGSRIVPHSIAALMTMVAKRLEQEGYVLRSGNAIGSDKAFEEGVISASAKEIFLSKDGHQEWAIEEAKKSMPIDRSNFDSWSSYVKGLMARNMMQILGSSGDKPVEFVICYTPSFEYNTSKVGGTGYAIRCAMRHNIPIINLFDSYYVNKLSQYLKQNKPIKVFLG